MAAAPCRFAPLRVLHREYMLYDLSAPSPLNTDIRRRYTFAKFVVELFELDIVMLELPERSKMTCWRTVCDTNGFNKFQYTDERNTDKRGAYLLHEFPFDSASSPFTTSPIRLCSLNFRFGVIIPKARYSRDQEKKRCVYTRKVCNTLKRVYRIEER